MKAKDLNKPFPSFFWVLKMDKYLQQKIDQLDTRRAQILQVLCEDDKVYHPEVLISLINEIRGITKILKILKS